MTLKKETQNNEPITSLKHHHLEVFWLKHSGVKIKAPDGVIYIDPYKVHGDVDKADILFISHDHYDHFDPDSIKAVVKPETAIFCSDDCRAKLADMVHVDSINGLFPNNENYFGHLKIKTTPAYNLTKPFHPKEKQWLGFMLELDNTVIYFSGDTDCLEELKTIQCDIAFFPVSGIYVMDPSQAAELANAIKPKVASIPVHWGSVIDDQNRLIGSIDDARKFCSMSEGPSMIFKPTATS